MGSNLLSKTAHQEPHPIFNFVPKIVDFGNYCFFSQKHREDGKSCENFVLPNVTFFVLKL